MACAVCDDVAAFHEAHNSENAYCGLACQQQHYVGRQLNARGVRWRLKTQKGRLELERAINKTNRAADIAFLQVVMDAAKDVPDAKNVYRLARKKQMLLRQNSGDSSEGFE